MTDKERILTTIVQALHTTQILANPDRRTWSSEAYREHVFNAAAGDPPRYYVHFANWQKPKAGDLVIGKTGSVSEWKIGWYVEPLHSGLGGAIIREIGSNHTCRYSNEEFVPIVGLYESDLLEGEAYLFSIKVRKVFRKSGEHWHLYGGVDFAGDESTIWVRERYGGVLGGKGESKPYSIKMRYDKHTTQKAILQALRDGGYGTREFERHPIKYAAAKSVVAMEVLA